MPLAGRSSADRAHAHARTARRYFAFGEPTKARAHFDRALHYYDQAKCTSRTSRFGGLPGGVVEVPAPGTALDVVYTLTEDEYNRIADEKRGGLGLKGLSFTDAENSQWKYLSSGRACVVMQRSGGVPVAAKIFVHEKENEKGKENEKEKKKGKEADYEGEFAEDVIEAPSAPARSQE
jgi:hypothetical protein